MPDDNGAEVKEPISQQEHPYIVRDRERRRIGQEIETAIRSVGAKIYAEAAKQQGLEGGKIDWSSWSTGKLILQTPIKLSELKAKYPLFVYALTQPIGEIQRKRDAIDGESAVTEVGYWNNPSGQEIAMQLRLKGGSSDPNAERIISLEGGYFYGKGWEMPGWLKDTTRYVVQLPEDQAALSKETEEAGRLVDEIIGGGNFKAIFASLPQRME